MLCSIGESGARLLAKNGEKTIHVTLTEMMTTCEFVGIASFDESAITFDVKVWVRTAAFIESKYVINENILAELNKAGIVIPFNQLDVHLVDSKA